MVVVSCLILNFPTQRLTRVCIGLLNCLTTQRRLETAARMLIELGGRSLAEGKMQTGIDESTINISELGELVLQGEDAMRVSPGCECAL